MGAISLEVIDLPNVEDCIYLIPISDTHIGDPLFNRKKLEGYLKWVAERPNAYILLLGDILNTMLRDSVGDIYREEFSVVEACQMVWEIFEPVKNRVLCWIEGNHELRVHKQIKGYLGELVCSRFNWKFFPDCAFLKIRCGKGRNGKPVVYTIYAVHGWGGGRTAGAKVNKLEQLGNICLADIYLMAHHHQVCFSQDIYYVPDSRNNRVSEMKRTFVSSGCFLNYGDYGMRRGFRPAKLGSPRLRLDATRKDCHVSF